MLYAFAFDRVGVVVGDLYFLNPDPEPGQEGAEQGVRLEVRLFTRGPLPGSIYSAQPISIDRPIWRADLLESVANPGSLDRAHHHPRFDGWEPGKRSFVAGLTADPLGWVGSRLADLPGILEEAGLSGSEAGPSDAGDLRQSAREIMAVVAHVLDQIRAGELAQPPTGAVGEPARISWL